MGSAGVRTSRMPEIENIALREALKDFGLEFVGPGDEVVVHVKSGSVGLFVSEVVAQFASDIEKAASAKLVRLGAHRDDSPIFEKAKSNAQEELGDIFGGEAVKAVDIRPLEWPHGDEVFHLLWQKGLGEAFDVGVDVLKKAADTMSSVVEETRADLVEIEMRRKRIDRTQARTQEILNELIG
ncbi:MAG: hypothetical protein ACT4O2_02350 [Beijerinckiaceae bacterium]